MQKSLISELPKIVEEGKKEAQRILDRLSSPNKLLLQTNELVLPAKDVSGFFKGSMPHIRGGSKIKFGSSQTELAVPQEKGQLTLEKEINGDWLNRLIYGDNILAMQALLAGDEETGLPSMRGKIDLIYIDPPFDSKADYRTKVTLPGAD